MSTTTVDDAARALVGTIWFMLVSSTLFLVLRLYCKWRGNGHHWDDAILVAAWVALVVNGVVLTIIYDRPQPRRFPPPESLINHLTLLGLWSLTAAVASQAWSKTSFAVSVLRISSDRWMRWLLWAIIISLNILFTVGLLFFWVGCSPVEKSWRPLMPGTCLHPKVNVVYGVSVSIYSGVADLLLAALPWKVIMPLKMKRKEKIGCMVAMSMGVFAAVGAFIKASKIPAMAGGSSPQRIQIALWGVIEPAITIMAASVPALRIFIRNITAPKMLTDV